MAGTTWLEPATSDVTGRRSNQLNYVPAVSRRYLDPSTAKAAAPNPRRALCYVEGMKICPVACLAFFSAALAVAAPPETPQQARKFIDDAEQKLLVLDVDASRADWIKSTYITDR